MFGEVGTHSSNTASTYGTIQAWGAGKRSNGNKTAPKALPDLKWITAELQRDKLYLLNASRKPNDSWRKGLLPSVEITAPFVIPNECEESLLMLRIS